MRKLLLILIVPLALASPVWATNLLTNGDFSSGTTAWNEWCATHFSTLIETTGYQDQWVRESSAASVDVGVVADGARPHVAKIGMWRTDTEGSLVNSFGAGGLCQTCSVVPGKYYRVSATFKGVIDSTGGVLWYNIALGLVDGSFNPGVWRDEDVPPASPYNYLDKFMMECGEENAWNMALSTEGYAIPERLRVWHNRMAEHNLSRNGSASWDWMSTMGSPSPRTIINGGIKKATGSVMTVVLQATVWGDERPTYGEFDDVVLEEVPGPTTKLGDLAKVDMSLPWDAYPDIVPQVTVDVAGKTVTGSFVDPYGYYYFYVEELDRSAGIRVDLPDSTLPAANDLVGFTGALGATDPGERNIVVDSGWQKQGTGDLPKALSFPLKSASAKLPYLDPFTPSRNAGLANTGLFARVAGTVREAMNDYVDNWVRIDDGSGVAFWLKCTPSLPDTGKSVIATGVVGVGVEPVNQTDKVMVLQIRSETASDDFRVLD